MRLFLKACNAKRGERAFDLVTRLHLKKVGVDRTLIVYIDDSYLLKFPRQC